MRSNTLSQLRREGHWNGMSELRENANKLLYVTLTKPTAVEGKNSAANIYFGRRTSALLRDNCEIGQNVAKFLKEANIVQISNEKKETRFKISLSGSSSYASEAELNEVFGESETSEGIDLELFSKEFNVNQPAVASKEQQEETQTA